MSSLINVPILWNTMVFKGCVVNCRSNYAGEEKTTIFSFPKEEHLWKIWIKFVKRQDWESTNSSYISIKHFEDKHYQKGEGNKRFRLIKTLKPVAIIFDLSNPNFRNSWACQITSSVSIPRKSSRKCVYQEDQYQSFLVDNLIKNFGDINENHQDLYFSSMMIESFFST